MTAGSSATPTSTATSAAPSVAAAAQWAAVRANSWMVEDIEAVHGVRHAVVITTDGLLTAASAHLLQDEAEKLAAACSAMASLGRSVADGFGEGGIPHHVVYELAGCKLFVRGAGARTYLAVITEPVIDPALIAHQIAATVLKIGEATLSTGQRPR